MVSYLIAKGVDGMTDDDVIGKSQKDLKEENRSVMTVLNENDCFYLKNLVILFTLQNANRSKHEINISKRTDRIQDQEKMVKAFARDQMTFHLDMQSAQNEMK